MEISFSAWLVLPLKHAPSANRDTFLFSLFKFYYYIRALFSDSDEIGLCSMVKEIKTLANTNCSTNKANTKMAEFTCKIVLHA